MTEPAPPIRRIVTGHDGARPVVLIDEIATNRRQGAPTVVSTLVWSSDRTPADIATGRGVEDMGARTIGIQPPPGGSKFVINDIAPGDSPMHRTESLDYVIVLAGEIDCDLPDETITLHTGDVLVQRGTDHAWMNRSGAWARIGVVLIDAEPLEAS